MKRLRSPPPWRRQRPPTAGFRKPPLTDQPTTLWDYPSQHYGDTVQGDPNYAGATPSYVIWNLVQRYTTADQLVVDPFCGSGTTLDVCRDLGRRSRGFDLAPARPDIAKADARQIPLPTGCADLVFLDPPYGDQVDYSDDPHCIGKLSAYDPRYFTEMGKAISECARVLKPGGTLGLYVCDFYNKKHGFVPVGMQLCAIAQTALQLLDIVAVTRHNKSLLMGNYRKAAVEQNFYLRGFNYLFLFRKQMGGIAKEHR